MQIHADRSQRTVLYHPSLPWQPSPLPGVLRRMLEREGDEIARATSVVRYEAGARFDRHTHALGEEFFVLEGDFNDEHGRYEAGAYVRNPPGSSHAPWSEGGCVLFVKLRQMDPEDTERVVIATRSAPWFAGQKPGLSVMPLSQTGVESTALVRWAPGTRFVPHRHYGGEEILVLEGVFEDEHARYPAGTWIRSPHLSQHHPYSTEGCTIWVKTGHLMPLHA
ncbi:MAG: cupin domain-containing protein [Deltaproteobacteria bacterium]|nr:cupin domain-containing protein [Deltaproteobacteria bacterium]